MRKKMGGQISLARSATGNARSKAADYVGQEGVGVCRVRQGVGEWRGEEGI